MYEKIKRICIIISILFNIVIFTGYNIQTIRLEHSRQECERIRSQLEFARNREQEFEHTINSIEESTTRTAEILRKQGNTISDIRKGIAAVKEYVEEMESRMYYIRSKYGNSDNDSNIGKEIE